MTLVQSYSHLHRKCPFVALSNSSPILELGEVLSNQLTRPLRANFPIAILRAAATPIPKYTKEDLL